MPAMSTSVTTVSELPLSEWDAKSPPQSAAITATASGTIVHAYVSQDMEGELRLYVTANFNSSEVRKVKFAAGSPPPNLQPQLVSLGDKVVLGWVEPNADNTSTMFYVAESQAEPHQFGAPLRVHESDGAQPTGIALASNLKGDLAAAWLDHRAGIRQPFAAVKRAGETKFDTEMQVYSSPNESGVCKCSPTAVAITPGGKVYVAFRNDLEGYRDIYVASREPASTDAETTFSEAERVVADPTWKFDGCPTDGPSLAADDNIVWVAWADASSGTSLCYAASKQQDETAFSVQALETNIAGDAEEHPKIVLSGGSGPGIAAVWHVVFRNPTATGSKTNIRYKAFTMPANQPAPGPGPPPGGGITRFGNESRPSLVQIPSGDTDIVYHQTDDRGARIVLERHTP
jgi:hypothetical protein